VFELWQRSRQIQFRQILSLPTSFGKLRWRFRRWRLGERRWVGAIVLLVPALILVGATQLYHPQPVQAMDKAQALRQAMLTTMKTHPKPRDWAAFTLMGEAN
jgi:hypothetical protein